MSLMTRISPSQARCRWSDATSSVVRGGERLTVLNKMQTVENVVTVILRWPA